MVLDESTELSIPSESQYVVPGDLSPEAITGSLQAILPTRHHPIGRHRFTLLDTFDGRVRRAGARLTRAGGQSASLLEWRPRGGGTRLAVRLKQPVGFAWDLPDGPLQQAVAPVIGVRRLLAQVDAEASGSLLDVLDRRSKTVARLRIETGHVRPPQSHGAWQPLPTMLTLTALRGYEDVYEQLVPVIESRPGVRSCPEGLDGVMRRRIGTLELGDLSSPRVDLDPTIRADVGARQIHRALLSTLEANEPGLRANLDTEFLHDFRVTLRRTRSLLGQIKHVFPPEATAHFSTEFSWLGRLAGPLRDVDVLVLALRERRDDLPGADMEALLAFLGQVQLQEHHALVSASDSDRYHRLLSEWEAFLNRPAPPKAEGRNAERLLAEVVSQRAWRLSRRIASSAEDIDEHTAPARLHEVRIAAKKLRYLIDVTPAFYDEADLACILGALKKLQRVLGDFNDAQVQETRLLDYGRALGAAGGPPGALLALGRLAEQTCQRRDRLRGQVVDTLSRFRARTTRSACRRAFKEAGPGGAAR